MTTDIHNCGACGVVYPAVANGVPTCSASQCGILCNAGFANGNGLAFDGCEVNLRADVNNCGNCGFSCPSINGVGSCVGDGCSIQCNTGFGNCNGNPFDGCVVNLVGDKNNCGFCGNIVSFLPF